MKTRISGAHLALLTAAALLVGLYSFGLISGSDASLGFAAAGLGGMILDERTEFCDATALNTGAAGSYLLGDVIDLDPATVSPNTTQDLEGSEMYLVIQVDTVPTSGGAATAAFSLASDAQAAIAVDGSQTEHFRTKAFTIAEMSAGTILAAVKLPRGSYERYLGVVQTTAVAAFTAGKINAFLTSDPALYRAYADNVA